MPRSARRAACRPVGDVVVASHQLRGARRISFGKAATPVGSSTRSPSPKREALPVQARRGRRRCGYPVEHHIVEQFVAAEHVLGMAAQSIHDQNFSMIQATWPTGESTNA